MSKVAKQVMLNKDKDDDIEIKTTVRITKGRLKAIKKAAIDESMSVQEMISKLIDEYVSRKVGKK